MKKSLLIVLISIVIMIIVAGIFGFMLYKQLVSQASDNIKLDEKQYLTAIEINSKSNFIIYINKENKISNIIFLNDNSVKSLFKQKIENNTIEKGIELIVEKLKENNEFIDDSKFQLIDYGNQEIYNKVYEEFNKEFVIYGVNKIIERNTSTIELKLSELKIEVSNEKNKNIKKLYDYSLNMVSSNLYNKEDVVEVEVDNMDNYASNIYDKLVKYSTGITNQTKDDITGIDITTINATGDYENELYADKSSWYYVENGQVYAYIRFVHKSEVYDYCYKGNKVFTKEICQ